MSIVEGILISTEHVAGIVVITSCTLLQLVQTRTGRICTCNARTHTVRNVDSPVHFVAVHASVCKVGGEVEMVNRTDYEFCCVGEVELLVIVLVLAHREHDLTAVCHVVATADNQRVVVKACSVRVEQRERRRSMTKISEHVLNIA